MTSTPWLCSGPHCPHTLPRHSMYLHDVPSLIIIPHLPNIRERGIPSQLYNWMRSTEMCLLHFTQPLWIREVRRAAIIDIQFFGTRGLTALLRSRTTDFYIVSSGIRSSNLSVTGPTLEPLGYLTQDTLTNNTLSIIGGIEDSSKIGITHIQTYYLFVYSVIH